MDKQKLEKFTAIAIHAIMSNPKQGSENVAPEAIAMVAVETAAAVINQIEAYMKTVGPFFIVNKQSKRPVMRDSNYLTFDTRQEAEAYFFRQSENFQDFYFITNRKIFGRSRGAHAD